MSDGGVPESTAPLRRADPGGQLTFNVARLLSEGHGATRAYPVAGVMLDLGDDVRQADPLEGTIHLSRTNRGLFVSGRLTTSLDEACSRCLKAIEVPVTVEVDEEALPSVDPASGAPLDTTAEPDVLRLTDHHELELGETVREAIWLAEPIAPLCRPDCPGLCPECGLELATGDHDHPSTEVDPRLEALRGFVPDRES